MDWLLGGIFFRRRLAAAHMTSNIVKPQPISDRPWKKIPPDWSYTIFCKWLIMWGKRNGNTRIESRRHLGSKNFIEYENSMRWFLKKLYTEPSLVYLRKQLIGVMFTWTITSLMEQLLAEFRSKRSESNNYSNFAPISRTTEYWIFKVYLEIWLLYTLHCSSQRLRFLSKSNTSCAGFLMCAQDYNDIPM